MAAILEWAGPLFLLFAPFCGSYQVSLTLLGLGLMVLMHIYIIVHLPFIDVFAINLIPILWSIYCFWLTSVGFDYADLWQMPLPLKLCFVGFALQTVYGQIYTDQVALNMLFFVVIAHSGLVSDLAWITRCATRTVTASGPVTSPFPGS